MQLVEEEQEEEEEEEQEEAVCCWTGCGYGEGSAQLEVRVEDSRITQFWVYK